MTELTDNQAAAASTGVASNQAGATTTALAAVDNVMRTMVGAIEDQHIAAAKARVEGLRTRNPGSTADELADKAIRQKCIDTGGVGVASSLPGLIPGIGSLVVASAGLVVDIRKTMEMQKDLVLELAAIYDREITPADRRNLLLLVGGVDSGNKLVVKAAGELTAKLSLKLSSEFTSKALAKAIPVAGIATSAAVNVVSTYLVGRRAQAYLRADPSLADTWDDALRTLSGVDERELAKWLVASLDQAQGGLLLSAQRLGGAIGTAGRAVGGKVAGPANAFLSSQRDRILRRSRPAGDQPA
ncbi:MAG: DUF697 domain-containing protein [Caldilineaceae bacterium]